MLPFGAPFVVIRLALVALLADAFNPKGFSKSEATCPALKRTPQKTETVEITLRYVDINPHAEQTIIMVHGWPGLWSTWSNQIKEFKNDYHLVVPDLRGFGESTHPGEARYSGNMGDMVGDLVCVLEHAKVKTAICMGHDWGSQVCYEAARMRPDIFVKVVGAVVPYIPSAGSFVPVNILVIALPNLKYQLYFDSNLDDATTELDKDIRRTVRATLRTVDSPPPGAFLQSTESFLDAWSQYKEIPPVPFFSLEEENYFVDQYALQGFKYTLQFYTTENLHASWENAQTQGNFTVTVPCLAIYPLQDPVANWMVVAKLLKTADFVSNLTTEILDGAHWVHLENPSKFNDIVRAWLSKPGVIGDLDFEMKGDARINDEL
ncbi:hypothetical protein H0H92_005070 [Tricholoma furcatifolium]|nr:hypothetical protein H0H92_005070 [Tricholoma furcatifolium]